MELAAEAQEPAGIPVKGAQALQAVQAVKAAAAAAPTQTPMALSLAVAVAALAVALRALQTKTAAAAVWVVVVAERELMPVEPAAVAGRPPEVLAQMLADPFGLVAVPLGLDIP